MFSTASGQPAPARSTINSSTQTPHSALSLSTAPVQVHYAMSPAALRQSNKQSNQDPAQAQLADNEQSPQSDASSPLSILDSAQFEGYTLPTSVPAKKAPRRSGGQAGSKPSKITEWHCSWVNDQLNLQAAEKGERRVGATVEEGATIGAMDRDAVQPDDADVSEVKAGKVMENVGRMDLETASDGEKDKRMRAEASLEEHVEEFGMEFMRDYVSRHAED